MNVEKKNFKDAANEDNYSVEIFIDKSTGELCYRNSLGQKILIATKQISSQYDTGVREGDAYVKA